MKIKSVTISGFHNVTFKTYEFDSVNYITGPNGTGKSTVINAIEYALFGYIPGTKKNSNEELFKHASKDTMQVMITVDDNGADVTVTRSLSKSGAKYVSNFVIEPATYSIDDIISDIELPVFNFNEFIGMTSNKLKDWFVEFLPSSSFSTNWEQVLQSSSGVSNILDPILLSSTLDAIHEFNCDGLDEVRKANEYIKSALSFKKQEAQRLQGTMQSLVYYDDFSSDTTAEEVRSKISTYETYRGMLSTYDAAVSSNAMIQSKLDNMVVDVDVESLRCEIDNNKSKLTTLSDDMLRINSSISKLEAENALKTKIINGNGICPYTSKQCGDVSRLVATYRDQVIQDTAKIAEYRKSALQLQSEITLIKNQIDSKELQFRNALKAKSEYTSLSAALVEVPDISNVPDKLTIDAELTNLHDTLVKLDANEKYQNMIDTLTKEKNTVEQSIEILKKWDTLTGINGLQATSGVDPFVQFATDMHEYLPDTLGDGAKIHFVSQGKSNSFSFGILRGEKYIPFDLLSSGEKCIFTLALLITIVKQSSSNLKILAVDDLFDHLDDTNMDMLFDLLRQADGVQMIFAGVKKLDDTYSVINEIKITK